VIVDDAAFTATSLENFLWITFTRSNPAADVHGVDAETRQKHWGCRGPLVIDARLKPHNAPPVEEDSVVSAAVDALAASGGPLAGLGL
jgi:4-hydroxy-3-polyprenylbenzoate decarboxylase